MIDNLFFGKGDINYFVGVVEDIADPLTSGRVRVRIVGWHNEDINELPIEALPWCYTILPVNTGAINGIGHSPTGIQPGTRVFGVLINDEMAQKPFVLGVIGGEITTENRKHTPYGNTYPQPVIGKLFGYNSVSREQDCPEGYSIDNNTINGSPVDPTDIKIDRDEWAIPFTGFVSSAYGERGGKHRGVDICPAGFFKQTTAGSSHLNGRLRGQTGLPVYAAADGVVVYKWTKDKGQGGVFTDYDLYGHGSRSFGNALAIQHTLSTGTFTTIYAHLGTNQDASKDTPDSGFSVSVGQTVKKGQQIGTAGRTHNFDSLTHLHFEIRVGTGLPKTQNHINPGRVFPQLRCRHTALRTWADAQFVYNEKPPYLQDKAPVKALDKPKVV